MKQITALLCALLFASPVLAETPCDFKGISVGDRMSPGEIMSALGVTQYKTNPTRQSLDEQMPLLKKYGIMAAGEIEDWKIGPYCADRICRIPYGVAVGNNNSIPVNVAISFHEGQIVEILVSFSESHWDEMLPIFDQKYGADWRVDRKPIFITDYETKKSTEVQSVSLEHLAKGTNIKTNDRCTILATNFDMFFEHHDALGPYHSRIVIQLISKNL